LKKSTIVERILANSPRQVKERGAAFAPANIALCKYWGKRDEELNLPVTSSLSMSLGPLGAHTELTLCDAAGDEMWLNGEPVDEGSAFYRRAAAYLDLFRGDLHFCLRTESTIPVAAGLASSASGYAALALALNDLFGWKLQRRDLSILARLGSGSASRSVYEGFVEWHAGVQEDGMDSYADRLDVEWPELRIGLLELSLAEKPISSREAMQRTVATSPLYREWPEKVAADLAAIRDGLAAHDMEAVGQAAESNAVFMHATMRTSVPPVDYRLPVTLETIAAVERARADGLRVYFTMDAGPNVKLLFLDGDREAIQSRFPALRIVE